MSREEVIHAMAATVLHSKGQSFAFADEGARQWWLNFVRGALRAAEANGWVLTQTDARSIDPKHGEE